MRNRHTIIFSVVLLVLVLIMAIFALTGLQQTLFHLFWAIFQIKYLIYFVLGLIAGYFTRYAQDKINPHK